MGDRFVRQYSIGAWHSFFGVPPRSVAISFSRSPLGARKKTLPDISSPSIPYSTRSGKTVISVSRGEPNFRF